jgi:hypothetical protein
MENHLLCFENCFSVLLFDEKSRGIKLYFVEFGLMEKFLKVWNFKYALVEFSEFF